MRRQKNKVDDFIERLSRRPLRKNTVTPEMLVGPMWIQQGESSGVEIIELNSSCEEDVPKETNRNNISHAWSYVNNGGMQKQDLFNEIDNTQNERIRQNHNLEIVPSTFSSEDINELVETLYDSHIEDCFDIINKNFNISDSSTEEEYRGGEMITSSDMIIDKTWNSHDNSFYNEDLITYNAALDEDSQTIWIYSYKNEHPLANDYVGALHKEMSNSSSSTSYSTDSSSELRDKSKPTNRIRSPMPSAYIPRLDLSQLPTLSTVTEMSEANAQPSLNHSTQSSNVKQPNNWILSENNEADSKRAVRKHDRIDQSSNVISCLGLSPRKRIRMVKNKSCSDTWVESHMAAEEFCEDKVDNGYQTNDVVSDGLKVNVGVEVHVDGENPENIFTEIKRTNVKSIVTTTSSKKIGHGYADVNKDFQEDIGDHDLKLVAPVIRLTRTSQQSNRNGKCEYKTNVATNTYDRNEPDNAESNADRNNNSGDRMHLKNTVIMRCSQGTQYSPTNQTPVSYHLSLGSITDERKTWCKRLMSLIICCK